MYRLESQWLSLLHDVLQQFDLLGREQDSYLDINCLS